MKIKDLILQIQPLSFSETLEYFVENAVKKEEKKFVVTINTEIVMLAKKDKEYESVIKSANLSVVDGIGVVWAGKIFGKRYKGRVHGSDLVEGVARVVEKKPITVGFLGGKQNVALMAANCLKKKYPDLKIAFAVSEWEDLARGPVAPFLPAGAHSRNTDSAPAGSPSSRATPRSKIINHKSSLRNSRQAIINHRMSADILFVAFGSPKQEKWIYENLPLINVKIAVGVGGAFDFISGNVRRAPKLIRNLGLEWLFRLIIQPWRIKRQIALPKFVFLVLKERYF